MLSLRGAVAQTHDSRHTHEGRGPWPCRVCLLIIDPLSSICLFFVSSIEDESI